LIPLKLRFCIHDVAALADFYFRSVNTNPTLLLVTHPENSLDGFPVLAASHHGLARFFEILHGSSPPRSFFRKRNLRSIHRRTDLLCGALPVREHKPGEKKRTCAASRFAFACRSASKTARVSFRFQDSRREHFLLVAVAPLAGFTVDQFPW